MVMGRVANTIFQPLYPAIFTSRMWQKPAIIRLNRSHTTAVAGKASDVIGCSSHTQRGELAQIGGVWNKLCVLARKSSKSGEIAYGDTPRRRDQAAE